MLLAAGLALLAMVVLPPPPLQARPQTFPVECRLGQGSWGPCLMTVEAVGERWQIEQNGQRLDFRHDGKGSVQMQRTAGPWQTVTGSWTDDQALCWDGVCARGQFPLD